MMQTENHKQRVLIIGLDGASPHLVRKWQSDLPNLSRLIENGVFGTLTSVNPPRSIPAWYCFATGMNPAKIGVFGFSQRIPGTYDYTFANMSFCQAPTFWQWLNRLGVKTAILHVPGTYPPHPVDGVMVSGWPGPENRGSLVFTHPPELSRKIDSLLKKPFEFVSPVPILPANDVEMLHERIRITQEHGRIANQFLKNADWQVGVVVFSPLDRASHQFWRHLDPDHPEHNPAEAEAYGDFLKDVYRACDDEIGRLLNDIGKEDTVFVVSDHGFGPVTRIFYLNEWLLQNGFLFLKDVSVKQRSFLGRIIAPVFKLNNRSALFRKLTGGIKKSRLSNFLRSEYLIDKNQGQVRINHLAIDWERTRAYSPDEGALYLNLKGRDPEGVVEPGPAAEDLIAEISTALKNIVDPLTNRKLDMDIVQKQTVYSGPFLNEAPDLLISVDGYQTSVMAEVGSGQIFGPEKRSGTHNMEGLFIANGPDIRSGPDPVRANILDIAPTVCHLVNCPVNEEQDGEVLLDILKPDSAARKREINALSGSFSGASSPVLLDRKSESEIEERLRDLGYLG